MAFIWLSLARSVRKGAQPASGWGFFHPALHWPITRHCASEVLPEFFSETACPCSQLSARQYSCQHGSTAVSSAAQLSARLPAQCPSSQDGVGAEVQLCADAVLSVVHTCAHDRAGPTYGCLLITTDVLTDAGVSKISIPTSCSICVQRPLFDKFGDCLSQRIRI